MIVCGRFSGSILGATILRCVSGERQLLDQQNMSKLEGMQETCLALQAPNTDFEFSSKDKCFYLKTVRKVNKSEEVALALCVLLSLLNSVPFYSQSV